MLGFEIEGGFYSGETFDRDRQPLFFIAQIQKSFKKWVILNSKSQILPRIGNEFEVVTVRSEQVRWGSVSTLMNETDLFRHNSECSIGVVSRSVCSSSCKEKNLCLICFMNVKLFSCGFWVEGGGQDVPTYEYQIDPNFLYV